MIDESCDPIKHWPAIPDHFEFDEEVARIFDKMAARSIPQYDEAREIVVRQTMIAVDDRDKTDKFRVLDLGASHGFYSRDLLNMFADRYDTEHIHIVACDSSKPMVQVMKETLDPRIYVHLGDAVTFEGVPPHTYDVINLAYVAQFVRTPVRRLMWRNIYDSLRPGGILFVSGKDMPKPTVRELCVAHYNRFRLDNGYTQEEIDFKTKALQNSMWPIPYCTLVETVKNSGFRESHELCRWLQFSTTMFVK